MLTARPARRAGDATRWHTPGAVARLGSVYAAPPAAKEIASASIRLV